MSPSSNQPGYGDMAEQIAAIALNGRTGSIPGRAESRPLFDMPRDQFGVAVVGTGSIIAPASRIVAGRVEDLLALARDGIIPGTLRGYGFAPLPGTRESVRNHAFTRFFEHPIFRRPGMNPLFRSLPQLVPVSMMNAATERWSKGTFRAVEDAEMESNLEHVIGILDIVDRHFDVFADVLGSAEAVREMVTLAIFHDLAEFLTDDLPKCVISLLDARWRLLTKTFKQVTENIAHTHLFSHSGLGLDDSVRTITHAYETGKPSHYVLRQGVLRPKKHTTPEARLVHFLFKYLDLLQGTQRAYRTIFPRYVGTHLPQLRDHCRKVFAEMREIRTMIDAIPLDHAQRIALDRTLSTEMEDIHVGFLHIVGNMPNREAAERLYEKIRSAADLEASLYEAAGMAA